MDKIDSQSMPSWDEVKAIAYRHLRKLLIAFSSPIALAILLVLFMPPIYRAKTDIVVKTGREFVAEQESNMTPSAPQSTKEEDINSEIELLNSRAMAVYAINKIGLKKLYPDLGNCTPWLGFVPDIIHCPPWGSSVIDQAVKSFQDHLDVDAVKMSNVISLTFDAGSPREAENVLDEFVAAYQELHAHAFASGHEAPYGSSLGQFLSTLDNLERRQTKIKVDNGIYDITAQRAALIEQRVEAQSKLQDTISKKATLEQSIAYLTSKRGKVPSVLPSGEMEHANDALVDLEQTEAQLATRDGDSNPELQRVRQQIRDTQEKMGGVKGEMDRYSATPSPLATEIDEQLVADRAELVPLQDELKRDKALVTSLDGELRRLEQADLELRTVDTRIVAMNSDIEAVQSRFDKAQAEEELDQARRVSVVPAARASASDKPYMPRTLLFAAAGVLLGILSAGGVIVFNVVTNKMITVERSVERLTGLPVLAALPNLELLQRPLRALPGPDG